MVSSIFWALLSTVDSLSKLPTVFWLWAISLWIAHRAGKVSERRYSHLVDLLAKLHAEIESLRKNRS